MQCRVRNAPRSFNRDERYSISRSARKESFDGSLRAHGRRDLRRGEQHSGEAYGHTLKNGKREKAEERTRSGAPARAVVPRVIAFGTSSAFALRVISAAARFRILIISLQLCNEMLRDVTGCARARENAFII